MTKELVTPKDQLVQDTISLIPEHTWPVVIDKLSALIVGKMPS